jgi:hypothetical protein
MGVTDDYLEDLGDSQRAELERIRRIVLDRVPDAEEGRSYGMPASGTSASCCWALPPSRTT